MTRARTSLRFAESAVRDLEEIQRWYQEQASLELAQRLVGELLERAETLREHPDLGRVVPEFHQPFLRELVHPPFRIVYRRDPGRIRVVRIWRSERLLVLPED